jgi:hypothetical protein
MESIQNIKQRFEIIGNDPKLNRAIEKAKKKVHNKRIKNLIATD